MLLSNLNLIASAPNGVARLRELILTLAVQGKLVPQNPQDEPASELLKRIRVEKDKLIAEGKIKRDKPLAPITDKEKPFELPEGWEWIPLQHIGYTQTGTTPDKKNPIMYGNDIPFIKPGDIYSSYVEYSNEALSKIGLIESGRIAPAGSLLMVCIGTIGKTNLIDKDCSFNQQINSITPFLCPSQFVKIYCRSPFFQKEAWARSSSTTIAILNKGKWEAIPFALPPLPEQSRIVTRVEELMRLCDALENNQKLESAQHAQLVRTLLDTLTASASPEELAQNWECVATHFDLLFNRPAAVDALEQTILQLAVRGLLVPQNTEDEFSDLPQGWDWVRLDEIAHVGTGTTPSRDNTAYFLGGSIPWVTSGETRNTFIAATAQHITELALVQTNLTLYPIGTLIIAMYGQGKTRGQISELQIAATTNQACAAIVLTESSEVHRGYIKLFFEKSYDEIREGAAGGAQPNLNVGKIKATRIPLPPLAEQSRIVARVEQLRQLCAQLRGRLVEGQKVQEGLAGLVVR